MVGVRTLTPLMTIEDDACTGSAECIKRHVYPPLPISDHMCVRPMLVHYDLDVRVRCRTLCDFG